VFVSRKNFLNWLSNRDFVQYSSITGNWSEWHQEACEALDKSPNHWTSLVPGTQTAWDKSGEEYIEQLKRNKEQGYDEHNTRVWSTHTEKPEIVLSFQNQVSQTLPLIQSTARVGCQPPGNVLPWHQDTFIYFSRIYPTELEYVVRFIVFVQDWKMGHVLQIGDSILSHWKAGDVVIWHPKKWHVSANIGNADKWTMNITGILKEEFELPTLLCQSMIDFENRSKCKL
jgi:hypothetical protein